MRVTPELRVKRFDQLQAGEIFVVWLRNRNVRGIHLVAGGPRMHEVLLLDDAEIYPAFEILALDSSRHVTTFGVEYVLELDSGAISAPGNAQYHDAPGTIFQYDDDTVLTVSTNNQGIYATVHLSVNKWKFAGWREPAAPVSQWHIWTGQEARGRPGAVPWFSCTVEADGAQ
jgi:hypothetical protein